MIALALICLLLAAALVAFFIVTGTSQTVALSFLGGAVNVRPLWIFVAGAAAMFLAVAGLDFFRRGTRRKVTQRREIKRLRRADGASAAPGDADQ